MLTRAERPASPRIRAAVADVAWAALDHPLSTDLTYACRRLLAEAAADELPCRDALGTVMRIAADLLAEADAADTNTIDWRIAR